MMMSQERVVELVASTGLRRRRPLPQQQDHPDPSVSEASTTATATTVPPSTTEQPAAASSPPSNFDQQQQQQQQRGYKLARLYCLFSLWLALVAVVTPPPPPNSSWNSSNTKSSTKSSNDGNHQNLTTTSSASGDTFVKPADQVVSVTSTCSAHTSTTPSSTHWWQFPFGEKEERKQQKQKQQQEPKKENIWEQIFFFWKQREEESSKSSSSSSSSSYLFWIYSWFLCRWIDPILLQSPLSPSTLTDLLDKILTSTPRLLALANLLLSWTYLLHAAVADYFLNNQNENNNSNLPTLTTRTASTFRPFSGVFPNNPHVVMNNHQPRSSHQQQHRLLGGFLVFKMLLVSAIVAPDTLDWMILLTWYTLLSFLRSLSQTCAQMTERAAVVSGVAPQVGVVQLLSVVLVFDVLAAACCVALFHGAGWGMVLLLTCDCALLGVEVIGHLLEYGVQFLETQHAERLQSLEQEELQQTEPSSSTTSPLPSPPSSPMSSPIRRHQNTNTTNTNQNYHRRLEVLEQQHARRLTVLESTIFAMQLAAQLLTCTHFVHIWSLHGVQFTLIDGVLALHLHSAVTAFSKKVADRRHLCRIARDLDGLFPNATELELRKAAVAGDVCCICLCGMNVNVKKVACGHLYHTTCLREVVERARSMEAARCPLCRSSVVKSSSSVINLNHLQQHHHTVRHNHRSPPHQHQHHHGFTADVARTGAPNNIINLYPDPQQQHVVDPAYLRAPSPLSTIPPPMGATVGSRPVAAAASPTADAAPVHPRLLPPPAGGGGAGAGDHNHNRHQENALFRFSTEHVFPEWLPLPAFAFEVVRRPSAAAQQQQQQQQQVAAPTPVAIPAAAAEGGGDRQSFLRRLLVLIGIPAAATIILTPEQEAAALDQLLGMFPQYDRSDLLRELRRLGSAEIVADSILSGSSSIVRDGGGGGGGRQ